MSYLLMPADELRKSGLAVDDVNASVLRMRVGEKLSDFQPKLAQQLKDTHHFVKSNEIEFIKSLEFQNVFVEYFVMMFHIECFVISLNVEYSVMHFNVEYFLIILNVE